jgi:hypothetical protein
MRIVYNLCGLTLTSTLLTTIKQHPNPLPHTNSVPTLQYHTLVFIRKGQQQIPREEEKEQGKELKER